MVGVRARLTTSGRRRRSGTGKNGNQNRQNSAGASGKELRSAASSAWRPAGRCFASEPAGIVSGGTDALCSLLLIFREVGFDGDRYECRDNVANIPRLEQPCIALCRGQSTGVNLVVRWER